MIDLRTSDSLTWSSFVFLYDSSISSEAKARIMAEIERGDGRSTFSFHNLGNTDQVDRAKLNMLFRKIPFKDIGGKFLFAVSKDIVSTILEEVHYMGDVFRLQLWHLLILYQRKCRTSDRPSNWSSSLVLKLGHALI